MDDFFGPPLIDVDEWRDQPFQHRYVHGGFESTDTRFAFYFPEPSAYEGTYDKPGTFFATFRAGAHREGDVKNPLRLVTNLARARVVVSA
jgi:hypothetical protein